MDSQAPQPPVICEVCGTYFETRRGLSSHARLHLRQLGVTLSENSGAPIELLYQLIRDRDGSLPYAQPPKAGAPGTKRTARQTAKAAALKEEPDAPGATGGRGPTPLQKTESQGSPARPKESPSSLLPASPPGLRSSDGSSSSSHSGTQSSAKPLWAPRETDAPITLDTSGEVHVCQLCGCWYGTRKGLSGHAREHLHQLGIADSDVKGSPIEFLYQIMEGDDLKADGGEQQASPAADAPARSSSKRQSERAASPPASPSKRPKTSEDCTCTLCGKEFENRKGLASHSRSHLREIGVGDLVGKRFAIDAVQELVSSGILEPLHPVKAKSAAASSAASSSAPASPGAPAASPGPSPSWSELSPPQPSPLKSPQAALASPHKAPKAKKGFRLAVDPLLRKPKPEPIETEVSVQPSGAGGASSSSSSSPLAQKSPAVVAPAKPSDSGVQSPPTVLCDYCGQLFETRKALSCHARAHLRQLGLSWSLKSSPIDLLKEVMMQDEETKKELLLGGGASVSGKWAPQSARRSSDGLSAAAASSSCSSPLDFSMKEKLSSAKETSCELCGFDFENRKALASHARAHLRQLGIVEWKTDGATSPIELLSELIRKDPRRVSQITRRYRVGDLYIKKANRSVASPSPSSDSDYVPSGSLKSYIQQQHEHRAGRDDSFRHSQGHVRAAAAAHSVPSVRSPRGVHPPKHGGSSGPGHSNSQHPPRSGGIPALVPKPPLTPLVKLVGKIYSLKCRFCEEVFRGPLSVQERWIAHLQKHILSLGYKGDASPPATPVTAPALVDPVAV